MAFMDDIKKVTSKFAKKTGDMVEVSKINISISQEKDKISKLYSEIGKATYEQYKAGNDVGFTDKCEIIVEHEATIQQLQQRIQEIKNVKNCISCGAVMELETAFCPQCGAKQ